MTHVFGCWFMTPIHNSYPQKHFLPQVDLSSHTTILAAASRTKLRQTFVNLISSKDIKEACYTFPLYDGVSVVSFKCQIGDKLILGVVKEKNQAKADYDEAVSQGKSAGLFQQSHEASDVFTTKLGNIPKGGKAVIEVEYVGELKHDAQLDGVRFTIPTSIAPRYGNLSNDAYSALKSAGGGKIAITVDVEADEGAYIEGLSSPSHPIAMTMGRTTTHKDEFKSNRASATLSLGSIELEKDFIIVMNAQQSAIPRAMLEKHPTIPQHRALMTTLVPKFNLPNIHPEIVFVVDRSGSMEGKMSIVIEALKVFLKSLPLSAKFNICSFGSHFSYLFPKSQPYDECSLQNALQEVEKLDANFGGTELLEPIKDIVKQRLNGVPLEIMVLTDGEIWNQQEAFDFVNEAAKAEVRLFSIGIGDAASTSLVEGLARAGNGFAQFVKDNEKMDKRVVRMLKAALTPHIIDYRLEVNYDDVMDTGDDGFEKIDFPVTSSSTILVDRTSISKGTNPKQPAPISLFDTNFQEIKPGARSGRYDHLPKLSPPKELQAPTRITGLFPFNRTCAYMLLPDSERAVKSVMLKGSYNSRPIQLEIPVQDVGVGKTIHQLAAKKAMLETEEGRGWLSAAVSDDGALSKTKYAADWDRIIEREAVRLGVQFQIAGKFCSFIAVEKSAKTGEAKERRTSNPLQAQLQLPAGSNFNLDFATLPDADVLDNFDFDTFLQEAIEDECAESSGDETSFSIVQSDSAHTSSPPTRRRIAGWSVSSITKKSRKAVGAPPQAIAAPSIAPGPASFFGLTRSSFGTRGSSFSATTPGRFSSAYAPPQQNSIAFGNAPSPPPPGGVFGMTSTKQDINAFATPPSGSSGGLFGMSSPACMAGPPPAPIAASRAKPAMSLATSPFTSQRSEIDTNSDRDRRKTSQSIPITTEGKMHRIIELQTFDGSWDARDELFKLADVSKDEVKGTMGTFEDDRVRATLVAIAWLHKVASQDIEVWEMVVDKAKDWLASQQGIEDVGRAIVQTITVLFP